MLAGGVLLAAFAVSGVVKVQRSFEPTSAWVGSIVLAGLGLILLAPGAMGSYLFWYLSAIGDSLYPEPVWLAYTLPLTQLPAAAGLIALGAAALAAWRARRPQRPSHSS